MDSQDDFGTFHSPRIIQVDSGEYKDDENYLLPDFFSYSNFDPSMWGFPHDWEDKEDDIKREEPKCECGSDSIKAARHSDWCPKYKRP